VLAGFKSEWTLCRRPRLLLLPPHFLSALSCFGLSSTVIFSHLTTNFCSFSCYFTTKCSRITWVSFASVLVEVMLVVVLVLLLLVVVTDDATWWWHASNVMYFCVM
jgi:hypothetical protein